MIFQRIITDANVRILVILKMIKLIVFFQIKMSFELWRYRDALLR